MNHKEAIAQFPELKGVLLKVVKAHRTEISYKGSLIGGQFRSALIKSEKFEKEWIKMIPEGIVEYLAKPMLVDNLSDDERKALKLSGSAELKRFLGDTKLHRVKICLLTQLIDELAEKIPHTIGQRLIKKNAQIAETVSDHGDYLTWKSARRLSYVLGEVIPFVIEIYTVVIDTYQ